MMSYLAQPQQSLLRNNPGCCRILAQEVQRCLLEDQMTDINLSAVDKGMTYTVRCHRAVLSCGSLVLRSLLRQQEEEDDISILLPDVSHHQLQGVVSMLYTGTASFETQEHRDDVHLLLRCLQCQVSPPPPSPSSPPSPPPPPLAPPSSCHQEATNTVMILPSSSSPPSSSSTSSSLSPPPPPPPDFLLLRAVTLLTAGEEEEDSQGRTAASWSHKSQGVEEGILTETLDSGHGESNLPPTSSSPSSPWWGGDCHESSSLSQGDQREEGWTHQVDEESQDCLTSNIALLTTVDKSAITYEFGDISSGSIVPDAGEREQTDFLAACYYQEEQKSPGSSSDSSSSSTKDSRDSRQSFSCRHCSKRFPTRHYARFHESSVHLRAKTHACTKCGAAFSGACYLRQHERRVHPPAGERPHVCATCGARFAVAYDLKAHARTHAPAFRCAVCARTHATRRALREHARTHTGERPYACEQCGRRFALAKTLRVHFRQHSGERPYLCSHCGRTFVQNSTLRNHLKNNHREK